MCVEIEQIMVPFLWGQKGGEKKVHWVSWKNLCKTKNEGGMGFKDLSMFNMALLTKHGWWIMIELSTLLHQILKARYFPTTNFFNAKLSAALSFTWRGLWEARKLLMEGYKWQIGYGKTINLWIDYWLPIYKNLT